MKKLNFTCPDCGSHELIVERPLQWIQYDILGFDDDGDLLLDYDKPSIVDDEGDDKYDIYCKDCYKLFSLASIENMVDCQGEQDELQGN
jgi:DNA-directed RNA polymerase subunit RPC12/RpoP